MNDALERARSLIELDRYPPARDVLTRVLADDPHNAEALCLLAQTCLSLHDYPAALAAAESAGRGAPDSEWPLRLASLAAAHLGDAERARALADAAVRVDPDQWLTYTNRASVDLVLDRVSDETVSAAEIGVRLAPHQSRAHRVLGSALLGRRRPEQAELAIREALRLDPHDAAARNELARVHLRRRKLGEAASGFADAAALDPSDDVAARNLVVVGAGALRVVHLVMWLVLILGVRIADTSGEHPQRAAIVAGWALAALALIGFAFYLRRGTGSHVRTVRLLRIVLSRDRLLAGWAGCLAVAFAGFTAAVFVPAGAMLGCVGAAGVGVLIGAILSWVRAARVKRTGR